MFDSVQCGEYRIQCINKETVSWTEKYIDTFCDMPLLIKVAGFSVYLVYFCWENSDLGVIFGLSSFQIALQNYPSL